MHRTRTATSAFSSRDRFGEGFIKCVPRFRRGQLGEPWLEIDHDVVENLPRIHPSVAFPDEATGAISLHRPADLGGGGNSNAPGSMRGNNGGTEKGGGAATSGLQDGAELIALPDPPVPAESGATGGHLGQLGLLWASGFLRPQALPALGPAPLDDESPASRSHADEEAVCPSSATIVGLERSLHCFLESLPKVGTCNVIGYCGDRQNGFWSRNAQGLYVLWLPSLARQTSCPILSSLFTGSLADPVTHS